MNVCEIYSFRKILVIAFLLTLSVSVWGQCLTDDQKERIIQTVENPLSAKENKKVRRELLKMEKERLRLNEKIVKNWDENQKLINEEVELGRKQLGRLCVIFSENGWLSVENIGADGLRAVLFLIRNSKATDLQKDIFPIIVAAAQKGKISKNNVASLIDIIRVSQNLTQIFGTQTFVRDEIAYLYPLENEQKTDEWRNLYDLIPLRDFIKEIEIRYQTPVIKIPRQLVASARQNEETLPELGGDAEETDEIIMIETKLVNLNVRVLEPEDGATAAGDLEKEDFIVYEDGKEQQIAFFSKTDTPFDLILMLDLSGSTAERRDIIIESTRRFIEVARPADRIAIVAFTHQAEIIADLTGDKQLLFERIREIEGRGGSKIWDALDFTYREIIRRRPGRERRSAIILMTDGIDNSISQIQGYAYQGTTAQAPSEITFTELFETVRRGETTIFSICVDAAAWDGWSEKVLRQSRRTLELLAEETGGQYYFARQPKDLRGIYERIINDLSRAYLISYEPDAANNLNAWRKIEVRVKDRPELIARTKSGYYAK